MKLNLAQPPRVKWQTDAKGEEYVNPAEVCGAFGWAQLHSWAQNLSDNVCPNCGAHAIAFASAFHDLVNLRLGKSVQDAENLRKVAAVFGMAARGDMKAEHEVGQAKSHAGHLHSGAKALDLRSEQFDDDMLELFELNPAPDPSLRIKLKEAGEHAGVYGCKGEGEKAKCKLLAIAHPRGEEENLLVEALHRKLPVLGDVEQDREFGMKLKAALAK